MTLSIYMYRLVCKIEKVPRGIRGVPFVSKPNKGESSRTVSDPIDLSVLEYFFLYVRNKY